jgi:lysophospholipase L1-like esterase
MMLGNRVRRYTIVVTIVALSAVLLCELGLRSLVFNSQKYYVWPPNYSEEFAPEPGVMVGIGTLARFKTNAEGIRGREWATDRNEEYRILAIGGSTTECLYLDQDKTWEALLESGLGTTADGRQVWVGNAGRSGLNTRDHVAFMKLAIDQYDVDAIIILIGANDLALRLGQGDAYDPRFGEDDSLDWDRIVERSFVIVPVGMGLAGVPWFQQTATWQAGRTILRAVRARRAPNMVQDHAGSQYIGLRAERRAAPALTELPDLESGLGEYERNIEVIAREAQRKGIRLVLLSQPVLWKASMPDHERDLLWTGAGPGGAFYTSDALAAGMAEYNQRLLRTCERLGIECFDLASKVPQTTDVFYDDMHFNEGGAALVSSLLRTYFQERAPFAAAHVGAASR